jgi:hypothetical protein
MGYYAETLDTIMQLETLTPEYRSQVIEALFHGAARVALKYESPETVRARLGVLLETLEG